MNRFSIVIAIAAALTVAWAAQTPAEHKKEWVVSSTPAMKGHTEQHSAEVECVPADDEFAEPIYVLASSFDQLRKGDSCPLEHR